MLSFRDNAVLRQAKYSPKTKGDNNENTTLSAYSFAFLLFALPFGLLAASPEPGMQACSTAVREWNRAA